MQIEEGKYYENASGQKEGPAMRCDGTFPMYPDCRWILEGCLYQDDGTFGDGKSPGLDLIAEWPSHAPADVILPTDETPLRVQILNAGAALTHGDRDVEYGPPGVNMAAAGALKAAFRQHLRRDIDPAELEALDMVMTKLGRIATGAPKRDTYIDAATYFAIAGEIALTPVIEETLI